MTMLRSVGLALSFFAATVVPSLAHSAADPYLWLESVDGKRSVDWIQAHNKVSLHALSESPSFAAMNTRFREILDSKAKIPQVTKHGDLYYNFWRDAEHERGIWRRTTLDEYRKAEPRWETVLDVDSLAKAENENWFWSNASVLPTDSTRALVSLSRGGADATVAREFDLVSKTFPKDGFKLPESKSDIGWIDRDHVFVGLAMDSTTMTTSGYARVVVEWTRGTPLASATKVYEDGKDDVYAAAGHDFSPGFERDLVTHGISFYSNEVFLRRDGKLVKIPKPDDADAATWGPWLLLQLRTDWTAGDHTYKAGSLVATKLDDFVAGGHAIDVLFEPTERTSLDRFVPTRNAVLIQTLDNVRGRVSIARFEGDQWKVSPMTGLADMSAIHVNAVDDRTSDAFWLQVSNFLTPASSFLCNAVGGTPERMKQNPSFFDASHSVITQHEAVSKDGTRIPYFEVAPKDLALDGNAPTLLTGYGGFEVPILPYYDGIDGSGWIARGGVFVVANIRGGGEFGPRWHQAAMKQNRPRAYEDFIAVAEDLVHRKVTSPKRLGCTGGSNGGLLVGNVLTLRPDLFGAVVCQSPLLDMHRYHKLLAGASWMSEYGDPDDPREWEFIRTFSPYENVKKDAAYPPVLFTSSMRDDRVHPGHARKMVAKMEAQGHDVLYYENTEGGHGGAANNKEEAFQSALTYTFLWKKLSARAGTPPAGTKPAASAGKSGAATATTPNGAHH
jgi:prolyl oligopeptidase